MTNITCYTLKMNPFLDCLIDGKFDSIGGVENWEDIHNEFIGLRENKSSFYILSVIKEIAYLKGKIAIILNCTKILSVDYSREFVMELKQCGCRGKFDWSDKVAYSNDIKAAISYSKTYIGRLERKRKELDDYYKRHGGSNMNRKDFEIWKVTLGRFMHYRIDYDEVTVAEYCQMMNAYERYCEVANAEENNLLEKEENGR